MPASISSAAGAPAPRRPRSPASAGPSTNVSEKAMLSAAFACCSAPPPRPRSGRASPRERARPAAARARRARPPRAAARSRPARRCRRAPPAAARRAARSCHSSSASATVATRLEDVQRAELRRRGEASTRATTAGTSDAGTPGGDQQRRDGERAVGVVVDRQRQRDVAEPRPQPVDRVRDEDPAQPRRADATMPASRVQADALAATAAASAPRCMASAWPVQPRVASRSCRAATVCARWRLALPGVTRPDRRDHRRRPHGRPRRHPRGARARGRRVPASSPKPPTSPR